MARQAVVQLHPGELRAGPDVEAGLEGRGLVERGGGDVDLVRVPAVVEQQWVPQAGQKRRTAWSLVRISRKVPVRRTSASFRLNQATIGAPCALRQTVQWQTAAA